MSVAAWFWIALTILGAIPVIPRSRNGRGTDPGEAAQGPHHDDSFYKVARPRAPLGISMIAAIDDFTADNGATEIVPGSHL